MAKQDQKSQSKKKFISPKAKINWLFPLCIVIATLIIYFPSLKNGFTNWDDKEYVTENKDIEHFNAKEIKFEFAHEHMGNYHPLSMLSLSIDHSRAQLDPEAYHLTNLIFHLFATLMAFLFIFELLGDNVAALVAAALFALHPMHVESVAWISERKDVLYGSFLLSALWAYVRYLSEKETAKWYFIFSIFFLLSLFSKAQAVVFPVLCLLIDLYKDRGINKKTLIEKIPLFIIALIFGFEAIHAQQSFEAIQGTETYSY